MYSSSNNVTISGVTSGITTTLASAISSTTQTSIKLMQTQILLQVMMVQIFTLRLVMKLLGELFHLIQLLQPQEDMIVQQIATHSKRCNG